jgi:hypothetical protein
MHELLLFSTVSGAAVLLWSRLHRCSHYQRETLPVSYRCRHIADLQVDVIDIL